MQANERFSAQTMDAFTSPEDLEQESPYDLLIVYATETGNALDVAEQIGREALRRRRKIRLVSADSYPLVHHQRGQVIASI